MKFPIIGSGISSGVTGWWQGQMRSHSRLNVRANGKVSISDFPGDGLTMIGKHT